jgi:hypothetical protein
MMSNSQFGVSGVGVIVGVSVLVAVTVAVDVGVGVGVRVRVFVAVRVRVRVAVRVVVGVRVGVRVNVRVEVDVGVRVSAVVGVRVGVGVSVGPIVTQVGVKVGGGSPPTTSTPLKAGAVVAGVRKGMQTSRRNRSTPGLTPVRCPVRPSTVATVPVGGVLTSVQSVTRLGSGVCTCNVSNTTAVGSSCRRAATFR